MDEFRLHLVPVHGAGHSAAVTLSVLLFRSYTSDSVRSWVRQCTVCARVKNPPKKSCAPLQQYTVGAPPPLERVAMDI